MRKAFKKGDMFQHFGTSLYPEQAEKVADAAKKAWKFTELPVALRGNKPVLSVDEVKDACAARCRTHGIHSKSDDVDT